MTNSLCKLLHFPLSTAICFVLMLSSRTGAQQSSTSPPESPERPLPKTAAPMLDRRMARRSDKSVNFSYSQNVGALCGSGASFSAPIAKPTLGCGVGITLMPLPLFFEVGVMGPQARRSSVSGYLSLDGRIPLASAHAQYQPQLLAGYSRLLETGHALDFGVALALPRFTAPADENESLRLEVRDYYTFANPAQHNIMLRIGWMATASD